MTYTKNDAKCLSILGLCMVLIYTQRFRGATDCQVFCSVQNALVGWRMEERKVVVVADDEEMVRDFLRVVFSRVECRFLEAATAEEALELVKREGPRVALVMLDAVMPGKGGVEIIPQVRREAPQAKVVLFSGSPGPFRKRALALGAHEVMGKPFRLDALLSMAEKVLGQERQADMTPAKAL